jgi:hypothetical protein
MNTKNETIQKTDAKFVLAALWAGHFLLWSFGDMLSLLQRISEPVDNGLLMMVAVPLALIQASMIFLSLVGKIKLMRWVNIILAFVFLLFNIGYIFEAQVGWEYLLGTGYILFNALIFWNAWKWSK